MDEQVINEVYAEVLGPEKRNTVRGYGIGVTWADVPGVIIERSGFSKEVRILQENLANARNQINASEIEVHRLRDEQDNIRKENDAALARHKAELEISFKDKLAEELNKVMQSVGFANLTSALEVLKRLA